MRSTPKTESKGLGRLLKVAVLLAVGGKPLDSLPAFVPVAFELTILIAGLATAFALFARSRLWPGKRPLSSMSPTFVESEQGVAIIGTPGGSRIITMVLLGILDLADGNGTDSWVSLPRFHHQYLPDKVYAESDTFTAEDIAALEAIGHTVEVRDRKWGNMHGVMWDTETGEVTAGSDPRWPSGRAIVR